MLCLTVFFVFPLHAEPDQRLIIHFTHELTESHHNDIKIRLNNIIKSEFTLAEHSDNLRWIVILHHRINLQKLSQYKNELLKDKRIKEIELDTILNKKHRYRLNCYRNRKYKLPYRRIVIYTYKRNLDDVI